MQSYSQWQYVFIYTGCHNKWGCILGEECALRLLWFIHIYPLKNAFIWQFSFLWYQCTENIYPYPIPVMFYEIWTSRWRAGEPWDISQCMAKCLFIFLMPPRRHWNCLLKSFEDSIWANIWPKWKDPSRFCLSLLTQPGDTHLSLLTSQTNQESNSVCKACLIVSPLSFLFISFGAKNCLNTWWIPLSSNVRLIAQKLDSTASKSDINILVAIYWIGHDSSHDLLVCYVWKVNVMPIFAFVRPVFLYNLGAIGKFVCPSRRK